MRDRRPIGHGARHPASLREYFYAPRGPASGASGEDPRSLLSRGIQGSNPHPDTKVKHLEKSPTGVYWGRFNPPHKGHLAMIRKLRRRCRLTVAIGSSEHKDERANPFSGLERVAMLRAYLKEAGIRGVAVVALNDGKSMAWAVDNLIRKCKPDLLFLSNEKNRLVTIAARKVRVVRFPRTGRVSSTLIRNLIAKGDPRWKSLTGPSVARAIEQVGGIRRIERAYAGTQSNRRSPRRPHRLAQSGGKTGAGTH